MAATSVVMVATNSVIIRILKFFKILKYYSVRLCFFLFFFPLSQNFQPIVLKIQLFQNRPKSSQSGLL